MNAFHYYFVHSPPKNPKNPAIILKEIWMSSGIIFSLEFSVRDALLFCIFLLLAHLDLFPLQKFESSLDS